MNNQPYNRAIQTMNKLADDPISGFYFAKLAETILVNEVMINNTPHLEVRLGDLVLDMRTVEEVLIELIESYAVHLETGQKISHIHRFVFSIFQQIYPLSAVSIDYPRFIREQYNSREPDSDTKNDGEEDE